MQATESSNCKEKHHIDDTINFRPSPNFKHMKKYLKSKFEEDQIQISEANEKKRKNKVISVVQPPLPPDSPPACPLTLKQEVEDEEYERAGSPAPEPEPARRKPAAAMCKDWVRGTCARGAACIYAHELDKSQLKGVYRFCRDYENDRCERQVCYFVHATTFEKEHFFRTAYLPPHALHHLKSAAPQPPPVEAAAPLFGAAPPAPAPPAPAAPPAPSASGSAASGSPAAAGGAGAALEARLALEAFALPMPAVALKREWRDDDFGSSPAGLEPEPARKMRKCNNCEITTLRLQHRRAAADEARRSSQELEAKLEVVLKKKVRLLTVLKNLLKPRRALEELNPSFAAPRLFAADASSSVMMTQMKMLIAKILLGGSAEARENAHEPA